MNLKNVILSIFLVIFSHGIYAQEVWTLGPMVHWHLGDKTKRSISFAIEGAYWNIKTVPYGVDFAMEFDKGKFRLYTEAQTGIGVAGVAFGPVLEFNRTESKVRVGIQGSAWANYFIGFDYRIRVIDKTKFHAFGFYGKLPVATSGLDDGDSTNTGGWDWDD